MSEIPDAPPSEETPETAAAPRQRRSILKRLRLVLRILILTAACALAAFWIYTFYAIGEVATAKSGMEWAAAMPMTLIFMLLTLPALIIGIFGRPLVFGALVAAASAFMNLWVWREILAQFAG